MATDVLKILAVEDDPLEVAQILAALTGHFHGSILFSVCRDRVGMQAALENQLDVIICDYVLPGFQWPAALELAKSLAPRTIFIVISGDSDDDRGLAAVRLGAWGYVPKDRLENLVPMVELALQHRDSIEGFQRAIAEVKVGLGIT